MTQEEQQTCEKSGSIAKLACRGVFGGILMGLANLVPGISGGTMLVAAGIYKRFIDAVAEVTTFKFRLKSIILLCAVLIAVLSTAFGLAGQVKSLVVNHRWVMYSIFIGLTLGGVPVVLKMAGKATKSIWIGAICGFIIMTGVSLLQTSGMGERGDGNGFMLMLFAGILAAGAMILPGISGGYLLLVLGVYVPFLGSLHAFKIAVQAKDFAAAKDPVLFYILPMGIGIVIGIVAVSNILKLLLAKFEKPTLGVLLGLLVGAVIGLWPFQQGVAPEVGDTFKGQEVVQVKVDDTVNDAKIIKADGKLMLEGTKKIYPKGLACKATMKPIMPDKYPTEFFTPDIKQILGAIGLIIAGFFTTVIIARLNKEQC